MAHEIVWTLRDKAALQREIELLFARAPERERVVPLLLGRFCEDLQLHPVEWPTSAQVPSEHTWTFGRISVRYRLLPSAQTVEILSVTAHHERNVA